MSDSANSDSQPDRQSSYLSGMLGNILFDEHWWFLRLSAVIVILLLWASLGVFFENPTSFGAVLWQAFRYMLTPLAAFAGVFILGASYVQDIYELDNFRAAMRYMWAAIYNGKRTNLFSGLVAGIASFLFFGLLFGLLSQYFYSVYVGILFGFLGGLLFSLLFGFLFGKNFTPRLKISDGQKQLGEGETDLVELIGGPGWLNVEPGNVVVMERLESPAGVLEPGKHFIGRFHRIKNIISLKDQHFAPKEVKATTKDGILVVVKDFQFRYRLYVGYKNDGQTKRTLRNPYPFSIQAARNMTYNRNVRADGKLLPWDNAVQNAVDGAITGFINRNFLDRLLFPQFSDNETRSEIRKSIQSAGTRAALKNNAGAELLWHDIGRFEVVSDVSAESIKSWFAKWQRSAKLVRVHDESELISAEGIVRTKKQIAILTAILDALDAAGLPNELDENMWNIVLTHTAQVIDTMTDAHKTELLGSSKDEPKK